MQGVVPTGARGRHDPTSYCTRCWAPTLLVDGSLMLPCPPIYIQHILRSIPGILVYPGSYIPGIFFGRFCDQIDNPGAWSLTPHFQLSATRSASKKGHGNCCRFATLSGVHQGAHICLAKFYSKDKVGARAELRDILQEKLRGR